jgi:hypothetical protein
VRPGEPWGEPASGPADLEVAGADADLAGVVETHPGALVRFRPGRSSDLARAVGLDPAGQPTGWAAPIDALRLDPAAGLPAAHAVNAVVLGRDLRQRRRGGRGTAVEVRVDGREVVAGPATTIVIASGQFVHGLDVVPRGHPGDGRFEVQVYALRAGEWAKMRERLPSGTHVPHPHITTASGREVAVRVEGEGFPIRVDGVHANQPVSDLTVTVVPAALRLLL